MYFMIYLCKKKRKHFHLSKNKNTKNHDYPSIEEHIAKGSNVSLQGQQTYISYMAVCGSPAKENDEKLHGILFQLLRSTQELIFLFPGIQCY